MIRDIQGGRGRGCWAVVVGSAGGVGREVALRLAERGRGAVVNVGGLDGMTGPGNAVRAAVAALDSLTRLWAGECGPRGVRINSVDLDGGGESGAIAEAVRFLVSPHAAYVQGSVLTMG